MIKKSILIALVVALLLTGCFGRIETGNVGVRVHFNKSINAEEVPPGWYVAVLDSVYEYVTKETELPLNDLTPKAGDNLFLQDLDVSIFYTVTPSMVAETEIKYSNMTVKDSGLYYPGMILLERKARGVIYDQISKHSSLIIHKNREVLNNSIKEHLQREMDEDDKGLFQIKNVVVRNVVTDPTLEESIQASVRMQKETERKNYEIELAKSEAVRLEVEASGIAKANKILAESLSDQYINYKQIEALREFAKGDGSTHTVILPSDVKPLVNIAK